MRECIQSTWRAHFASMKGIRQETTCSGCGYAQPAINCGTGIILSPSLPPTAASQIKATSPACSGNSPGTRLHSFEKRWRRNRCPPNRLTDARELYDSSFQFAVTFSVIAGDVAVSGFAPPVVALTLTV